ncbi:MAG TPA: ABC transporter substrate-binding protein [Pedococcus sp.]|jgi:peptide/nickel transport system substrate-binding protein|nr:ABC transporter substrate-binding protein [Pedococcus sp.]
MRSARPALRPFAATASAVALAAALLVAPGSAEAAKAPVIFKVATSSTIDTFNPFISIYLTPTGINRMVYENLVQYSAKDSSPVPGLAEKWDTSPDGKVWTFHIRKGMKWSDGQPITSADPQWTYTQMMTNPDMGTANGSLVTNFEKVDAPDPDTLVITMKDPQAPNPGLEIPVVPKHVWEKVTDPVKYANDANVVGSGPYVLEKFTPSQSVVLKANPNFWKGKPKLDGVTYVIYKNSDASVQALKTGEVDMVGRLEVAQFDALKGQKGITTNSGHGRRFTGLGLNPGARTQDGKQVGDGNPVLKDKLVRQAIRQAINIPELLDKTFQGHGTLATSFIPAVYPQWQWKDESKLVKYDPAAANAKLDQAGYKKGADGIRLDKSGKPITLRLLGDNSDSSDKQKADFIVPWLKAIGINVKLVMTDGDTISADSTAGKYDMYFTAWSLGSDPDYQLGINTCDALPTKTDGTGSTSMDYWCDPEFDRLFKAQHAELDQAKRQEIVKQMQAIHYDAAPSIDFWYPDSLDAYRSDRFTNLTKQPEKDGVLTGQSGYWALWTAEPVGATEAGAGGGGMGTGGWIGLGALAVLLIGGGTWAARRRTATADERE